MNPDELRSLAEHLSAEAGSVIPDDAASRYLILAEATRAVDYWTLDSVAQMDPSALSPPDLQILQWGWNELTARTLLPLGTPAGVPLGESTVDAQFAAMTLLHQFGRAALLRRTAEIVEAGLLTVRRDGGDVHVQGGAKTAGLQAADILERSKLERIWDRLFTPADDLKRFKLDDELDARMAALTFPWPTPRGVMMGYDAEPEIDDHFSAVALSLLDEWRTEAGLHPGTRLGGVTGADLTAVAGWLIGLHLKHIRFTMLAVRRFPEISFRQSLTIWKERSLLVEGLLAYTPLKESTIRECLDLIALRPEDRQRLSRFTHHFRPLLIDLGNGFDLYPVSSADENPFSTIRRLLEWRDSSMTNRFSAPREAWMRRDLYALFQGNRYRCVEDNIKVRRDGRIVTDIDAAIYDVVSREVALFQIKWQDFDANEVRALRSKAKNFVEGVDLWADEVGAFVERAGETKLRQCLRLRSSEAIGGVHLFGLSRAAARFRGYGYELRNQQVAVSSWPQFCRVRFETGPIDQVFSTIYENLKAEMHFSVSGRPLPVQISTGSQRVIFHDLWNSFDRCNEAPGGSQGPNLQSEPAAPSRDFETRAQD